MATNGSDGDRLNHLRALAEQVHALDLQINEQEERLARDKARLHHLLTEEMPSLMVQAGVDHIGLPSKGNEPSVDFQLSGYYRASIPQSWSPERRDAAFQTLERLGGDPLIKATVSVEFAKNEVDDARGLLNQLALAGLHPKLNQTVHQATASAWLRELYEQGTSLTQEDLELINGSVGQIVKIKRRD